MEIINQPENQNAGISTAPEQHREDDEETIQVDDEEEEARSRVIVHRRVTRGGGFFSRRKDNIANNEDKNQNNKNIEWQPSATNVKPGYSSFKSGIIKLTPESLKCKLYCRGSKCIYCNPEKLDRISTSNAWIDENILAMARPTERTFNEFNLIEQFKKTKIKTLINLQCVNEHDFCGPQLITQTGFSYDPEILMSKQIYYYNFAIPDFGTVSVHSILNIAKVIWFSLKKGRVAIHCHAGLGRTGTLIACFLVWAKGISTSEAIDFVRNARPNSVQSLEQINAVEEFSYHVYKNGTALPNSLFISNNGMISLRQLMTRQRQFLPNEQARRFAHIPKLLYMIGDNLLRMVFGQQGIYYSPLNNKQHHARSCTFGTIHVNWRNAFTPKGKLQVRQVVNLFARCSAFPYEKDQNLIGKFQQISLVTIDSLINEMDISQLVREERKLK
uniref:TYR_PHOSPHATASE_2 domain-containing protein n=1 Tax=Meloidogyne hapla TaxID=6305 RepID=A0A1I8BGC2_MELHA